MPTKDHAVMQFFKACVQALLEAMVDFAFWCRIMWMAVVRPQLSVSSKLSAPSRHPTLVLFVAGLGGPAFMWRPIIHDFRKWQPRAASVCDIKSTGNVHALRKPMHHDRYFDTAPVLFDHCRRWGDRARLVLVGHSLGAVDVVWLGNLVRQQFQGAVPTMTVAVCGAFGTGLAPYLRNVGVHRSVSDSLHRRHGMFMRDLLTRARTLPHHPDSRQMFVMSSSDQTVVPASNSVIKDFPGQSNAILCVQGAGHFGTVSSSSPDFIRAMAAFIELQ